MTTTNQTRRGFLGLLMGTVATVALTGQVEASPRAGGTMVIFVSADDCGPCKVFEAQDFPQFAQSALARTVKFVRVKAPKSAQAFQAKYWPKEAQPYLSSFKAAMVPSFMVVSGGAVMSVGAGLRGWRDQALPRLQQLAQA
ncbi:MAG: hypothetical protein FJX02_15220 [Alphaproteobacteria bacterium]|nr:hypothetical protein [Alphaproteobacteria bacterium]